MDEELIRQVAERAGIPPEKARVAVETVLRYLKAESEGGLAGAARGLFGGRNYADS